MTHGLCEPVLLFPWAHFLSFLRFSVEFCLVVIALLWLVSSFVSLLFYFPFFLPVGDLLCVEVPRQKMVSESKLYLFTDLALIFFDYYNFTL